MAWGLADHSKDGGHRLQKDTCDVYPGLALHPATSLQSAKAAESGEADCVGGDMFSFSSFLPWFYIFVEKNPHFVLSTLP